MLHIPLIIVLLVVNGLSLLLKWRQSNWTEVWKKSITALIAAGIFTIGVILLGVHDPAFIGVCAAAFFALFVNLEIGWKILRGHWNLSFDRSAPTSHDYIRRLSTALGITLLLGLISLLIGSAGDYNLFGSMILQFGPYFAILFALLITIFVIAGYPKFIFDTKFLGAYVAHIGLAIFVIGVIAANGYTKRDVIRLPIHKPTSGLCWKIHSDV